MPDEKKQTSECGAGLLDGRHGSLIRRHILPLLAVLLSSALMAVNIKSFIAAGGLYPGGASGLTLLIQRCAEYLFGLVLPYSAVNFLLNAFPVWVGFRFLGRGFTLYSCLSIAATGIIADLLPVISITEDITLICIFGGLLQGTAVSMCLMAGTTTGGTDFIAIYYSQKKNIDCWNAVLAFNVTQLAAAGLLFGWDKALYSIIFQYTSTQVIKTLYRHYQKKTLLIVTNEPEAVCRIIHDTTGHGATVLEARGGYEAEERRLVYSVIAEDQSAATMRLIRCADPSAFINAIHTDSLAGQFYQRPMR
ncbi:MAG: YitT family protein [Mailhella sp.]|nr:YitT family protein [Mailhella sp.]